MQPSRACKAATPHHHSSSSAQPQAHTHCSAATKHHCTINTKLKPGHGESTVLTQIMANNCISFDTLAKQSYKMQKYTALISVLMKEFENWFQDCKKHFGKFATPFSFDTNTFFQMGCTNLQSDSQLKNLIMSLYPIFIREIPLTSQSCLIHVIAFGSSTFVNNCCQGQSTEENKAS